jgi:hypothetical protein
MFRALTVLSTFSNFFTQASASTIYPPVDLSTLDGITGSVFNGALSNDQIGAVVAGAGDINGDGLSDFAIGAPNAWSTAGQVSVIFGAPSFNFIVDLSMPLNGNNGFVIVGESANNFFGSAIASGDFNRDGVSDLVVGAPGNGANSGKGYVIYGTRVGFNATFSLATLNGINGFVISPVLAGDRTGYSVAMGDVNGDGFSDLLIGATAGDPGGAPSSGSAYTVYGSNQTSNFPSPFQLNTLDGIKGSRFNTGLTNYKGGSSVAIADINGDGFGDSIIGAPGGSPGLVNAGVIYVVFGTNTGFPAAVNLSSTLNGLNGFSLYGAAANEQASTSLAADDINGDGLSEIVIGAPNAAPGGRFGAGTTYVLYGATTLYNATYSLTRLLDDSKGFKVNGEKPGDASGRSLGIVDINGNGLKDLMIGAPSTALNGLSGVGTTYIILDSNGTLNTTVELSAPSSNRIILRGGAVNVNSGFSVAGIGDINGDGLPDISIGAKGASPYDRLGAGAGYLVYGDSIELMNNRLTISAGGSKVLTLSDLNASVSRNPEYTQYTITGLQHGYFGYTTQPDTAITQFSGQDIMMGRVNFTHDDTKLAPSFSVAAAHTLVVTTPVPANVTFISQPIELVNNSLIVNQAQPLQLDSTMMAARDPDNSQHNPLITYIISGSSNGFFSPLPSGFSQDDINNGRVYFLPDGSARAPQYSISIRWGGVTIGPISAVVNFDTTPISVNHFNFCQGQTTLITPDMFNNTHPGTNSSDTLTITIENLQYGFFQNINAPGVKISSFSQGDVNNGRIQFVHDGSSNPPSFRFSVSSSRITTLPDVAGIYFTHAPILKENKLSINEGNTVIVTESDLQVVNPDDLAEDVKFSIQIMGGGDFVNVSTGENIVEFYQSHVRTNKIAFKSNSTIAPRYDVLASNQCSETLPSLVDVNFNSNPSITNNQLIVTKQDQPVILTTAQLDATDRETLADNLSFNVTVAQGGCFRTIGLSQCITVFPRQAVRVGTILFAPDGSGLRPDYNVSATDGVLWDGPRRALVTLNTPSVTVVNTPANTGTDAGAIVGGVAAVVGTLGLLLVGFQCHQKKKRNEQFKKMLEQTAAEQKEFKENVVYPIANKIFKAINTTGFCGQRTEADTNAYMTAIESIVSKLREKEANLDFDTMAAADKESFLTEIATLTRQASVPTRRGCGSCTGHFKAEATPQEIQDAAEGVASAAVKWQKRQKKRGPSGGASAKNTSLEIELIASKAGFSDEAANGEPSGGVQQLTWMLNTQQQEQKALVERLSKLETAVFSRQQGATALKTA